MEKNDSDVGLSKIILYQRYESTQINSLPKIA